MAQGNYDHPSYLTRQMMFFQDNANSTTVVQFPWDVRVRTVNVVVRIAGTVTTGQATVIGLGTTVQFPNQGNTWVYGTATGTKTSTATVTNTSTTTMGSVVVGTNSAGTGFSMGDLNFRLPAGQQMTIGPVGDATHSLHYQIEYYLDPVNASWAN